MPIITRYDILLGALTAVLTLALFACYAAKKRLSYPPGPRRLPIIGNLFNMPSREEWVTYKKWSEEYGSDVIHVDVMGSHIVILNSTKAGHELLEKRSAIYSDRYGLSFLSYSDHPSSFGLDWSIGFIPYGPTWRHLRRQLHINILPTKLEAFRPFEQRAVHQFLRNLLASPDDFSRHIRHMAGQVIMSVAYGIQVRPEGDPFLGGAENVLRALALGTSKEASLFDTIPWLIHLPSWFPGTRFKRRAREWRLVVENALQTTFDKVKGELDSGTAAPSIAANMISKLDEHSSELDIWSAKAVPGAMYLGGADTTVCSFEIFILAMTWYPEVQRKAHAEIDRVVGYLRLPNDSDQDTLPYIQAVVKEVLRWHPVNPLCIPHRVTQNDVYEGHLIPAGSIVIPNVWAMLHDPNIFPEPDRFYPERWLSANAPEFPTQAFGFGARLCPGRFFARKSIWAIVAGILAAFEIAPTEDGPPEKGFTSGLISYVKPFRCYIRPRSKEAASLVRNTEYEE
ncbi:cytochrome P450 [Russula compacta]|nr:cytochrome P450 [Russula compacta]